MARTTTGPVAASPTLPMAGPSRWTRAVTVAVTAAALVGVYLVPAWPAVAASGDGLSEADRAAAAAAAAPPAEPEDEGNWFTDLFGGGLFGGGDEPEAEPAPRAEGLATREHAPGAGSGPVGVAPAVEPERVRELVGKRTASTRTFAMSDGTRQVEIAGEPLFYESAGDGFQEIDTRIARTGAAVDRADAKGLGAKSARSAKADGWVWANAANTARSFFGGSADRVVRVEAPNGQGVTVGLPGAAAEDLAGPAVDAGTVTHSDVDALAGADLVYEVAAGRVKESIVLTPSDVAALRADLDGDELLELEFSLSDLGGLEPRLAEDGSVGFFDPDLVSDEPVVGIPAPVMFDSREVETTLDGKMSAPGDAGAAVSTDLAYGLAKSGQGAWTLSVALDAEGMGWLLDEDRVGDVTIDPTIIVSPTGAFSTDTMVLSEAPDASYYSSSRLSVGRTAGGSARALLRFDQLADLDIPAGAEVYDASLDLYYDQAHTDFDSLVPLEVREVTAGWESASTTWNTMAASGLQGGIAGFQKTYNNAGSADVSYTGSWPVSSASETQYAYNGDYQYSYGNGDGSEDLFTVEPNLPEQGLWQTRVHHVPGGNRAQNVPVDLSLWNGTTRTYSVDMSAGTGGVWSVLPSHTMAAGAGNSKVEISDRAAITTRAVIADAVRLVHGGTATRQPSTSGKWHQYDVTRTVNKWLTGQMTNNGFMVRATDETGNGPLGGPRYQAGEDVYGGETRNMPRLTVSYGNPGVVMDIPDTIHATGAELSWSDYQDPSGATGDDLVEYQVHRSVSQTFTPDEATLVAPVEPGTTTFTDTTATPTPADAAGETGNLYYYQVAVKRRDGQVVPSSTQIVRLPKAGRTTKVLVASGDTSLASGTPTLNLDTVPEYSPTLGRDTQQDWALVGNASATYGDTRTVAEWDETVWDVPADSVILGADLQLWQAATETDDASADRVYEVRRQNTDFDQTTATWNSPGTGGTWPAGGNLGSVVMSTVVNPGEGPARWAMDVSAGVQNWVNNPSLYRGLVVKMRDENLVQDRSIFNSGEAWANGGLERSGPRLVVEYLDTSAESTFHAPDVPDRVSPGSAEQVDLTLANTTQSTWTATGQQVRAAWTTADGVEVGQAVTAALPQDMSPGEAQDIPVTVTAPPTQDGQRRGDLVLNWEVVDTPAATPAEQEAALPAGKMKQNVAIEDPTSDQLGLESFYTYAGKNTGAGSTVMNNVAAGNAVWSYDAFSNPGRGLSTFARVAYNSQDTSDTVLGNGWSAQLSGPIRLGAPLDFHPNPNPTEILLPDGDGTTHAFRLDGATDTWVAPAGVNYRLTQLASDTDAHCPTDKDYVPEAWELLRPDGTRFVFGCDGYQTKAIDKNGNTMSFTYASRTSNNQPRKFLEYITDPAGRRTLQVDYWTKGQSGYSYVDESTGNLVEDAGKLSNSKIYDHVRSITDVSGRTVEFYYTTQGNLGRIVDGAGATGADGQDISKTFQFLYEMTQGGKNIKLAKVTDPRGNPTSFDYYLPSEGDDPKDHWELQTITDRLGKNTGFDYVPHATNDGWWNTSVLDAEGNTTAYVSDDFGRPRSVTNAKSETVSLTWDSDNNVRTLTEANGAVTAYCYDPLTGYPVWQRDAEQNAAHGGPPAASECAAGMTPVTAPGGAQVMEYDTRADGHVAYIHRTTSPEGRANEFSYDAYGNLLTVTDGKGLATSEAGDYTTSYTYDQYGQLLTATDANDNTTEYREYTDVGYPVVTEDALGNVSRTTYSDDGRGLVTQVEDPLDGLVTQAYDAFGRPLAGTTRKSADETITTPAPVYDFNDNVTTSTAPNGAVSTATYDKADQVTKSTMPKDTETGPDRVSQYEYDTVGNLATVTEPKGVATTGDATDFVTTYGYDAIYQQTSVTNADGDVINYSYDEVGNVIKTVDPKKNATPDPDDFTSTTAYDLNHRPVSATDAAGNTRSTEYDADGLAVSSTDPDGNTSYVTYDVRGAQVETKSPHESVDGVVQYRTTKVEYDEVGNTTRVITPRGVATADPDDFASRTEYDALNRPVRSYQPYDPADTRYNDANVYTETTYDAAGRVVKTSMPASEGQTARNESATEYFDNGWIKKSADAWDISTTYEYDDLGAQTARTLTSADGSANRTMTWSYFPDGKLKTKADDGVPVGSHSVVTDNDTAGLAEATGTWATGSAAGEQGTDHRTHAAASSTDEFTWTLDAPADGTYAVAVTYPQVTGAATDAKFTLTHGKDGDGHGGVVTEPAYTVNQTAGAGGWSDVGQVELRKGDPVTVTLKPSANGTVVADGVRLVRDNAADTDTEARAFAYSYDVNGNLTGINDTSSGARADDYQVAYTGLNQVASVKEALAGQETATTSYTYDVLGQPLTVAHPDQRSEYTYDLALDPRGPLTSLSVDDLNDTAAAKVTRYSYDNRGMLSTETKANGNVVTNGYFLDGALKSLREEKSGGALVASHTYTYDNNGNKHTDIAAKANADVAGAYLESTTTYSYDPVDRLAESVKTGNGAKTETYVHDDNANVISQNVGGTATTYSYDRNRLLTTTADGATASYRYDPFGRQTSVVSAGVTISRTTYDGFDHIATSEKLNDAGAMESSTYTYDPLDRTASKTAGGETTDYTYLGLSSEVLGEEVAGQLTKSYQYSPWGQRLSQITHQADPEAGVEAGESAYYGYNAHTDVETLTDDTGNAFATYGYTAYGDADESEYTGIDKPEAGTPEDTEPYNAYRYSSKRWDAGSGTYDMGFRDYAPGLNRFTTRDMYNGALADMGLGTDPYTGNRYAFTAGNPISMVEIDGHFFDDLLSSAVSAVRQTISAFSSTMSGANAASTVGAKAGAAGLAASMSANVLGFTSKPRELEQSKYNPDSPDFSKNLYVTPEEANEERGRYEFPVWEGGCAPGGSAVHYNALDERNRATGIQACLSKGGFNVSDSAIQGGTVNKPWISDFEPGVAGWDLGGGFERSHLLGNQLGGSGTDLRNLVSLYPNANDPGMREVEDYLAARIKGNDTIFYAVQAHYTGSSPYPHTTTLLWSSSVTRESGFCMVYNTSAGTRTPGCLPGE
ncbi:golvesin C-terminal-like domain-containing protein [Promicromonospora soli]